MTDPITGTINWVIGGTEATTGGLLDLVNADVTGGTYTADQTIEPTGATASFTFPDLALDPAKVHTFVVALESWGDAVLAVSVGGTTYYTSTSDPNVDRAAPGDLLQLSVELGPGVAGSPVFTVTNGAVWSVQWDGGVDPDTAPTPEVDPVFAGLESVPLHVVAALVPAPTLVAGRPV